MVTRGWYVISLQEKPKNFFWKTATDIILKTYLLPSSMWQCDVLLGKFLKGYPKKSFQRDSQWLLADMPFLCSVVSRVGVELMGLDGGMGVDLHNCLQKLCTAKCCSGCFAHNPKSLWGNSRVHNEVPRTQGQRLHINKGTKETYSEKWLARCLKLVLKAAF